MKINWFSNAPWASTGYGVQTRLFVPRMQALGHEMTISAFYGLQGARITGEGIPVYPVFNHPYGQDVIDQHAKHAGAECIISLVDCWIINGRKLSVPWFPWYPVDHEPMPVSVKKALLNTPRAITMSKFGQRMAEIEGFEHWYVPHAVDTKVFKPIDRVAARKKLGLPEDKFIVGLVAANKGRPPRKAFYEQITAFLAMKQKHKDVMLYLHTDDGTHGGETVNLVQFIKRMGVNPGEIVFADQYALKLGLPDDYMVAMYNSLDVLTLVSRGEGFGIPLIEAQACGTPVITGDWTSMGELCFSGWKVDKSEARIDYDDYHDSFFWIANIEAITDRMLSAYTMRGNQGYRQRARDGALAYDVNKVFEKYWKPVLMKMEEMVNEKKSQPYEVRKVEL